MTKVIQLYHQTEQYQIDGNQLARYIANEEFAVDQRMAEIMRNKFAKFHRYGDEVIGSESNNLSEAREENRLASYYGGSDNDLESTNFQRVDKMAERERQYQDNVSYFLQIQRVKRLLEALSDEFYELGRLAQMTDIAKR